MTLKVDQSEKGSEPSEDRWVGRADGARALLERVLLAAEEEHPADSDFTAGAWLARVQETVAISAKVTLRLRSGSPAPDSGPVASELAGVFADVVAEALRAAAWLGGKAPTWKYEVMLGLEPPSSLISPTWEDTLAAVAECCAELEPMSNALREEDFSVDDAQRARLNFTGSLLAISQAAFGQVFLLCG